jgi:hypothetical protein
VIYVERVEGIVELRIGTRLASGQLAVLVGIEGTEGDRFQFRVNALRQNRAARGACQT